MVKVMYLGGNDILTHRAPSGNTYVFETGLPRNVQACDVEFYAKRGGFQVLETTKEKKEAKVKAKAKTPAKKKASKKKTGGK